MRVPLRSAAAARAAADAPTCYVLHVVEDEADHFDQPGWTKLASPRDGGVVFIHRERELLVVRMRGVL